MDVSRERLQNTVERLAATPRPRGSRFLTECREWVAEQLAACGWHCRPEPFSGAEVPGHDLEGINLVCQHQQHPVGDGPRLCVGAHLDSRPETPGADDNASAVAALLEIARLLPGEWPQPAELELELVVFDLEEDGMLGGAAHAKQARRRNVDLRGMVSLEMLAYCDHAPGSQQLPRSLIGLYPDTGDFIAVIGNQNSTQLIDRFAQGLRTVDSLPVETLQVPENGNLLQATRLSDHSPFWDAGFAALMLTDTSFLRNPHYHQPSDTPDTLDFHFLTKVTAGSLSAVRGILADGLPATLTEP